MLRKCFSIFLTYVVMVNLMLPVYAADSTARTIVIFSISGDDVTMTKGTERSFKAKEGLGLFDGYTVTTGKNSNCHLKMDEDSLLTMDQSSKIQISRVSSTKLSASVLSGAVSMNAGTQKDGDTLEIGAGNSTLAIRGTLFLAGYEQNETFSIAMITGSGEVDGLPVDAGSKMLVSDVLDEKEYQLEPIVLETETNPFLLETIIENKEEVVEAGVFSEEEIEKAAETLAELNIQRELDAQAALENPQELPEEEEAEPAVYFREPSNAGSNTSAPPAPTPTPSSPSPPPSVSRKINAATGGTVRITANDSLRLPAVIKPGVTLEVAAGATLSINSTLTNQGTILNYGTIDNNTATSLHNYGSFENYGTFNNTANGAYHQYAGGEFLNRSSIFIQGGTFESASPIKGTVGAAIAYSAGGLSGEAFNSLSNFYDSYRNPISQPNITAAQYRWDSAVNGNQGGWIDSSFTVYTVSYNLNGGTGTVPSGVQVMAGDSFTVAGVTGITPPAANMQFKEWNTEANGTGASYAPGSTATVSADVTLYAIWGGNSFTFTESGGKLTITGYTGPTDAGLNIPSAIDGKPVVAIGDRAFYNRSDIVGSLTIPDSVITIGDSAFYYCNGFTGSLTIPDSVTSIGNYAFYYCSGFTGSLTISDSVTTIGNYAFRGCRGFTGSLTIPNSITIIADFAFSLCSGFTGSLTIPDSVTTIGNYAFDGCVDFTGNLTIPDSVTSIGNYAFASCRGFTGSLTIPDSVTSIGNHAFEDCTGFTGSLTIPDSVKSIDYYAFMGCSGFTGSLTIPDSVKSIGVDAFYDCSGLDDVYFLGNAPTMGGLIFNRMKSSFKIYYPNGNASWPVPDSLVGYYPQDPFPLPYFQPLNLRTGLDELQIVSGSGLTLSGNEGSTPPPDNEEGNTGRDERGEDSDPGASAPAAAVNWSVDASFADYYTQSKRRNQAF